MNKNKWWHEYVLDVIAWVTGWNLIQTIFDLCACKAYMGPLLVVDIVLSLMLMASVYHLAKNMEMIK